MMGAPRLLLAVPGEGLTIRTLLPSTSSLHSVVADSTLRMELLGED